SPIRDQKFAMIMLLYTAAVAFAMVSPIRWRSQKGLNLQRERSLIYILGLAAILGIFSKWPRQFLFVGSICYLSSGPLVKLWSIAFPSHKTPSELLEATEVS